MTNEETIRRYNKYLKTLRKSEELLLKAEVKGCITLEQINEAALKSNREAQQLVQQRINLAARAMMEAR